MSIEAKDNRAAEPQIWTRLNRVFREVFDAPGLDVGPDTTAADIDEWDSVGYITLIVSIEREFGIEMIGPEIGELQSAGDIVELIASKLAVTS